MPTTDKPKWVQEPNKRLLIWGCFRSRETKARYRFTQSGELVTLEALEQPSLPVFKLDRDAFFQAIRPEIGVVLDGTEMIYGDDTLYGYKPVVPYEMPANALPLQLTSDSLLLEPAPVNGQQDNAQMAQQIGQKLFKQLAEHMKVLASFLHPSFNVRLAQLVADCANRMRSQPNITLGQFLKALHTDHALRSAMIQYLTCFRDDEAAVTERVRSALETANGTFSFLSTDPESKNRQLDNLLRMLKNLKGQLRAADLGNPPDWYGRYSGFTAYRVVEGSAETIGEGNNFAVYYNAYMDSAEWVARFLRAHPLQAHLFCYLASLFRSHNEGEINMAALAMFKWGIQEQPNRTVGDSEESMFRRRKEVNAIANQRVNDADSSVKELLVPHLSRILRAARSVHSPKRAYTRGNVFSDAVELWVAICEQALEGAMGKILQEFDCLVQEQLDVAYNRLLREIQQKKEKAEQQVKQKGHDFNEDEAPFLNAAELGNKIKNEWLKDQNREFKDAVLKSWKAHIGKKKKLTQEEAKSAFNKALMEGAFDRLIGDVRNNQEQLQAERKVYEARARLWLYDAQAPEEHTPGRATAAVTSKEVANLNANDQQAAQDNETTSFKGKVGPGVLQQAPTTHVIDLSPAQLEQLRDLPHDQEINVRTRGEGGTDVGTLKLPREDVPAPAGTPPQAGQNQTAKAILERSPDAAPVRSDDLELVVIDPNGKEKKLPAELIANEWEVVCPPQACEDAEEMTTAAQSYADLYDDLTEIHRKLTNPGKDAGPELQCLAAAFALCLHLWATPRSQVNLEAVDMSNVTGVTIEMVKQLAGARADELEQQNGEPSDLVKRVDLSKVYPLADADQDKMTTLLKYHYDLCSRLKEVREYLEEVREVGAVFEGLKSSDLEVQVINDTVGRWLKTHGAMEHPVDEPWCNEPVLAMYLTRSARPTEAALTDLSKRILGRVNDVNAPQFQIPILFASHRVAGGLNARDVPCVCLNGLPLPPLGLKGEQNVVPVKPLIQWTPDLLWVIALLTEQGDLGKPTTNWARDVLSGLPSWPKNGDWQTVLQYLRTLWTEGPDQLKEVANRVKLAKLINLCLACGFTWKGNLTTTLDPWYGATPDRQPLNEAFGGLAVSAPDTLKLGTGTDAKAVNNRTAFTFPSNGNDGFQIDGKDILW